MALWALAGGRDDVRRSGSTANVMVVGWSRTGDLTDARLSRDDVACVLQAAYPNAPAAAIPGWADQLWAFVHEIGDNDLVATRLAHQPDVAFGRVAGSYRYDAGAPENRRHQRPVEWFRRTPWDAVDPALRTELETPRTVHRVPDRSKVRVGRPHPLHVTPRLRRRRRRERRRRGRRRLASPRIIGQPTGHRDVDRRPYESRSARDRSSPNGRTARWVKLENAKPGTMAWNVTNGGKPGDLEGYASTVSAVHGDTVVLYVSTTAPTFHVEAYRMGWYRGAVAGSSGSRPRCRVSSRRPRTFTPGINMTEARWEPVAAGHDHHQLPAGAATCSSLSAPTVCSSSCHSPCVTTQASPRTSCRTR